MAEALAERGGIAHRLRHLLVDGEPGGRGRGDADTERAGVAPHLVQVGRLRHVGVVDIAGHPPADRVQIGGALAHRVGHGEEGRAAVPVVGIGIERDPAARGLEPDQPAVGGRHPRRAGAVARIDEGHHAGRQRRRRAAAGAARRALQVPGVAGAAEERGLGREAPAELGRVAAAEQHEPRLLDPPRVGHVGGADEVLEVGAAVDQRDALPERAEVLEQEGHALERAIGQRRVGGGLPAIVEERDGDRVQRRVQRLDAADRRLGELARAHFARLHQPGDLERIPLVEQGSDIGAHGASPRLVTRASMPRRIALLRYCAPAARKGAGPRARPFNDTLPG